MNIFGEDIIVNLWTASGKEYEIVPAVEGIMQYADRKYCLGPLPDCLSGALFIRTSGNDKMYEEDEACLCFDLSCDAMVYIMHGNTFSRRPGWLLDYNDTGIDILRPIEDDDRGMSFSLFRKSFSAGTVEIGGDLPKGFLTPPFKNNGGAGYCMFSVFVVRNDD